MAQNAESSEYSSKEESPTSSQISEASKSSEEPKSENADRSLASPGRGIDIELRIRLDSGNEVKMSQHAEENIATESIEPNIRENTGSQKDSDSQSEYDLKEDSLTSSQKSELCKSSQEMNRANTENSLASPEKIPDRQPRNRLYSENEAHHTKPSRTIPEVPFKAAFDIRIGWQKEITRMGRKLETYGRLKVTAPPGVGKTSIIVYYLRKACQMMPKIYPKGWFLVDASSVDRLRTSFAAIAGPNHFGWQEHPKNTSTLIAAVSEELRASSGWVIVYYCLDDQSVLEYLSKHLSVFAPQKSGLINQHVIISTHVSCKHHFQGFKPFEISTLSDENVKKALSKISACENMESGVLAKLLSLIEGRVLRLLWISLSLSLHDEFQNIGAYYDRIVQEIPETEEKRQQGLTNVFTDIYNSIGNKSQMCILILDIASFCHRLHIPFNIFQQGLNDSSISELEMNENTEWMQLLNDFCSKLHTGKSDDELKSILSHAQTTIYELVSLRQDDNLAFNFNIHPSVQEQIRKIMTPERKQFILRVLGQMFLYLYDAKPGNLGFQTTILPHVQAYCDQLSELHVEVETAATCRLFAKLNTEMAGTYLLLMDFDNCFQRSEDVRTYLKYIRHEMPDIFYMKAHTWFLQGIGKSWIGKEHKGAKHLEQAFGLLNVNQFHLPNERSAKLRLHCLTWLTFAYVENDEFRLAEKTLGMSEAEAIDFETKYSEGNQNYIARHKAHDGCQRAKLDRAMAFGSLNMNCSSFSRAFPNVIKETNSDERKQYLAYIEKAITGFKKVIDFAQKGDVGYRAFAYKMYLWEMEALRLFELQGAECPQLKEYATKMEDFLDEIESKLGLYHRYRQWLKTKLANLNYEIGTPEHLDKALNFIERAIVQHNNLYKVDNHPKLANKMFIKGKILFRMNKPEEAIDLLTKCCGIYRSYAQEPRLKKTEETIAAIKRLRCVTCTDNAESCNG